tara:strand:+ start:178 stop:1254 length:1077 start_codon:yes stop_codon:yes gene_type:complete
MRKHTIHNIPLHSFNNRDGLFNVLANSLRTTEDGGYYGYFGNPNASKLNVGEKRSTSWVESDAESIVVIDDSRQEVANIAERGLITTSMLLEDILQTNYGWQDYEYEKNKFFVQDDTRNKQTMMADTKIGVLDLIWFMRENGFSAVEVLKEYHPNHDRGDLKLLSSRYKTLVEDYVTANYDKVFEICNDACEHFFEAITSAPENQGLEFHDDEFTKYVEGAWKEGYEYSTVQDIVENYFKICKKASAVPIEPISFAKHFEQTVNKFSNARNGSSFIINTLADKLGYTNTNSCSSIVGSPYADDEVVMVKKYFASSRPSWKVIAESEYKRNNPYRASAHNILKIETLMLRNDMEESQNV